MCWLNNVRVGEHMQLTSEVLCINCSGRIYSGSFTCVYDGHHLFDGLQQHRFLLDEEIECKECSININHGWQTCEDGGGILFLGIPVKLPDPELVKRR